MLTTNRQLGYSLIELMIAIILGSFLILGAAYAFQEARKTYTTNDNVAKLYEQGQYALDILEEDIRMTNFWGRHNQRSAVFGDSNDPSNPVAAVTNISGDCSSEWALDLRFGITGSNNDSNPAWAANGCADNLQGNTDTLVVRHADPTPIAVLDEGQVYIRSDESGPQGRIFAGTTVPTGLGTDAQNFEFLAHAYYVSDDTPGSANAVKIPTLMRKALVDNGSAPAVESQEIIRGVEDFQVQFGVDYDVKGQPGYGIIDHYINPDHALMAVPATRVLAVRFWLLLRAERSETGYTNENIYTYANVAPTQPPNDGFRRLLVSKTVQIRNMTNN